MEKHNLIEEFNTELSVYLGMLYLMIEVFKPYDEFSEELSKHTAQLYGSLLNQF